MKLILASNNKGKQKEIQKATERLGCDVLTLGQVGINHDTIEDRDTLERNAKKKAEEIRSFVDDEVYVLADDSGIFVKELNNEPGVKSARYAGDHDDEANIKKILVGLEGKKDRTVLFRCVLVLKGPGDSEKVFEGNTFMNISEEPRGENGFGYDPILEIDGRTFAEMTDQEKAKYSPRVKAVKMLEEHLREVGEEEVFIGNRSSVFGGDRDDSSAKQALNELLDKIAGKEVRGYPSTMSLETFMERCKNQRGLLRAEPILLEGAVYLPNVGRSTYQFKYRQRFNKEAYSLEFVDGSTRNPIVSLYSDGTDICVLDKMYATTEDMREWTQLLFDW